MLIGTPGTGKRPIGSYLARERGFVHLDFENEETRERLLSMDDAELAAELERLRARSNGVVITWAAGPASQLRDVRRLRLLGADAIWADSDRGAACRAHYAGARRIPRFRFVDTFEPDGRFRAVESVVADLLRRRPAPRPDLPRLPVARLTGDLRFRLVAAASALAGAAAATAVVLTGIGAATSGHGRVPVMAGAGTADSAAMHVAALPRRGVLVSGRSLAGVRLGDSMAAVRALWGGRFTRCRDCKPAMWFYLYPPPADPVGAGVQFENGTVVAVFTLGAPPGWHTETGIRVGEILDNPTSSSDDAKWLSCAGYAAKLTETTSDVVTSILTQGAAVYGFALTRPSVSPCH